MVQQAQPQSRLSLLEDLDRVVARISERPELYQIHEFGTRRAALHRFPYVIVFRQHSDVIEIIAVMHGHRKPGYWRDRT